MKLYIYILPLPWHIVYAPCLYYWTYIMSTYPNTRPTLQPLEIVSLCWFALGHHPGMTATDISLASCARTMWVRGKRPEAARSWRLSRYLRWSAGSVPMYGSHLILLCYAFGVSTTTVSPTIIAVERLQTCAETLRNTTCTFSANVILPVFYPQELEDIYKQAQEQGILTYKEALARCAISPASFTVLTCSHKCFLYMCCCSASELSLWAFVYLYVSVC